MLAVETGAVQGAWIDFKHKNITNEALFLFEGEALNTLARSGFYRVAFLQSMYILYQIQAYHTQQMA